MIKQVLGRTVTISKAVTRMQMDCIDMLRMDHMKVELMLIQLRFMKNPQKRRTLFGKIHSMVLQHMKLEEDLFYPASSHVQGLSAKVGHSYEEHREVRSMMDDLSDMYPRSNRYNTLLTQLIMKLEHHVMTEENTIFPRVMKKMDHGTFRRLNRQLTERHEGRQEEPSVRKAA